MLYELMAIIPLLIFAYSPWIFVAMVVLVALGVWLFVKYLWKFTAEIFRGN